MKEELNTFIEFALNEDIREGDHTSLACIPNTAIGKAQLLVKENGVLAGMEVAQAIFEKVNTDIQFFPLMKDGESMAIGNVAFIVEGPSSSILTAERLSTKLYATYEWNCYKNTSYSTIIARHTS